MTYSFPTLHPDPYLIDFFLLIDTQSTRAHIDEQQQSANNRERLEKVVSTVRHHSMETILEEIPMRMSATDAPEIIDQNIEHTQQSNEKHSRVFCLESNRNHNTS